jgi:protein-tyrosine phosphatase
VIDIHSHVLPGIDDGVKSMDEAIEFCRIAYEDGTRTLIATPHMKEGFYDNPLEAVRQHVAALEERLDAEGIGLRILPGCEAYFSAGLVEGIREGRIATLADGKLYLLLELPFQQQVVGLEETVFNLKVAGITPIMAHPERIRYFQEDLDRLESVLRQGALSQLTSSSLIGRFGRKVEAVSLEMVRRRMVHFLASDSHDLSYRPPRLSAAVERLSELVGEEAARATVDANPSAILQGKTIEAEEPSGQPDGSSPRSGLARFWNRLTSRG